MAEHDDYKRHAEGWEAFVKFITYSVMAVAATLILLGVFLLP